MDQEEQNYRALFTFTIDRRGEVKVSLADVIVQGN